LQFDYIIIGGGTAGCVLANRLSERPGNQVALIEAGPDTHPDEIPESIYREGYLPDYFEPSRYWTELEVYRDPIGDRGPKDIVRDMEPARYEQARMMGGCSAINAQIALRGVPSDYDEWESMGAKGWSYKDCLPYFRRVERDMDFDGPYHGKAGRTLIRRTFPSDWGGFALAFRDALAKKGFQYYEDAHAEHGDGCFPYPKNNVFGRRISALAAYLDTATRQRKNLHILGNSFLERLEFEGKRAVAIYVRRNGRQERLAAKEIIISAGALHSPGILMRAGIGPAEHLREHGIDVLADRPGVGSNLQDHPLVGLGVHLRPQARLKDSIKNSFLMYTRFSSDMEGCPSQDMKMSLGNRFNPTTLGHQFAAARVGPDKAFSRGIVRLRSVNPETEPLVAFNLLSDERDIQRMVAGVKFAYKVLTSAPVTDMTYSVFAGAYTSWIRRLSSKSWYNDILTGGAALMLDNSKVARDLIMNAVMASKYDIHEMIKDDEAIEEWVRATVLGNWHACCTCSMGSADDRNAVVDPQGRVYGVEGLRVIDASIMPSIPCANTNLSTLMIAEKISDAILAEATTTRTEYVSEYDAVH
jgi:5-(hydroxymethyl)furfural/furfural oxidase